MNVVGVQMGVTLKNLHIPKLVVPTGLTEDGRPSAIQLWGKAVPYERMFDDGFSAAHDADFLNLVKRVVDMMYDADPSLRRVDATAFLGWDAMVPQPSRL